VVLAKFSGTSRAVDQAETVSRRVEKFAELMQSVWLSRNDYERRIRKLLLSISETRSTWTSATFTGTYANAKSHSADFAQYKQTLKRQWVEEKQDLGVLFGNVQIKLRGYGLREYVPPEGLSLTVRTMRIMFERWSVLNLKRFWLQDMDNTWNNLLQAEAGRSRAINAKIREYVAFPFRHTLPLLPSSSFHYNWPTDCPFHLPAVSKRLFGGNTLPWQMISRVG
jgi:hypothetical protein